MAIAKIILNGVTQMDLTSDTIGSSTALSGYTGHGANGEIFQGSYVAPTATDNLPLLLSNYLSSYSNSEITTIRSGAFYAAEYLKEIHLNKLTSIPNSAFYDCAALSVAEFSSGLSRIGVSAFCSCYSLSSTDFISNVNTFGDFAFSDCTKITEISLNSSSISFGKFCFDSCRSLAYANLSSLTFFGATQAPFRYCWSLSTINMPYSVAFAEGASYVFASCGIVSVDHYFSMSKMSTYAAKGVGFFDGCPSLQKLHIDGMSRINSYFARYCAQLSDIYFPSVVAFNGNSAFYGCTSLTKLTNEEFPLLTTVSNTAFYNCYNISIVSLSALNIYPLNTATATAHPFASCSGILEVSIPNSQYPLGYKTTVKYSSVQKYTYGGGSEINLYSSYFTACNKLHTVVIRNGLSYIAASAFYNCTMFESLYLVNSSMTTITALSNTNAFNGTPMSGSDVFPFGYIYVPESLYSLYIAATNWAAYSAHIAALDAEEIQNVIDYGTHNPT